MPGKTKTSAYFHTLRFFGGRGWMSRAAHLKKPRRGFFARRTIRRADAVRIHPPGEFSLVAKQKTSVISTLVLLVGAGGFEPPKLKSSRFTVCPHWPLGNTPIFTFCVLRRTTCLFYHAERLLSTVFLPFSSNAFSVQRNGRAKAGKALQPCRHGKVGEKSQPEEIDRQIARKTRDNM